MNIFILNLLKIAKSRFILQLAFVFCKFFYTQFNLWFTFILFLLRTHSSINYLGGACNILAVITC